MIQGGVQRYSTTDPDSDYLKPMFQRDFLLTSSFVITEGGGGAEKKYITDLFWKIFAVFSFVISK